MLRQLDLDPAQQLTAQAIFTAARGEALSVAEFARIAEAHDEPRPVSPRTIGEP